MEGYGFTYMPAGADGAGASPQQPTQLFAWQICLVHPDRSMIEDADNYPDYLVNRGRITQALGMGMAQGQNAFQLDDQLFAAAISIQNAAGDIEVINESYPGYADVALVVAEQLLRGADHGMVAQFPNGNLVPFVPPTDAADL
mgnify:CR=1 FL=1